MEQLKKILSKRQCIVLPHLRFCSGVIKKKFRKDKWHLVFKDKTCASKCGEGHSEYQKWIIDFLQRTNYYLPNIKRNLPQFKRNKTELQHS